MKTRQKGSDSGVLNQELMYLYNTGQNFECYHILGAHKHTSADGKQGFLFSVWAPNARSVSVVCDSNGWDRDKGVMIPHSKFGIWERFMEGVQTGENYKFSIETSDGKIVLKADPVAFYSEVRPATASVTADISYDWGDKKWMKHRAATPPYDRPINIYELHFGSWKTHEDGSYLSYTEMADELIPYLTEMGYTHVEMLPLTEYPFDGSWGYQVSGYYSANSRYGTPVQLKEFIDRCHAAGIGVLMDWVPAHFPKDEFALAKFDGTCLYEHPDSRRGEHFEWGTLVFDWTKSEIFSFLISNAVFWLSEYHLDGLRVDAVSSMLYLDYNRSNGEWLPNKYGGKENLEAIEFLRQLNRVVFERFPNVLMIAEESTSWGGVTKPAHEGGLGFNYKWNMGWMNDILRYMSMDPYFRKFNHSSLTFSMMYSYSENFILALSHDEVVHGKKSLIDKMYGTYEEKFAGLRLLYAYMYAHPGKKLLFMGDEFAQFIEWRFYEQLDWILLDYETHRQMMEYSKQLNHFYKEHKAFHTNDMDWNGFEWINADDADRSILSFIRSGGRERIVVVANFTPVEYGEYVIGVPSAGEYEVVFSTDDKVFGGRGIGKAKYKAVKKGFGTFAYTLKLDVPPLSAIYLKKAPRKKAEQEKTLSAKKKTGKTAPPKGKKTTAGKAKKTTGNKTSM
uniref:1,4-alpha-glucan branching enzyme GlgB n=1 Tax=uncultured Bacillota bacterium TaxID=344338 RepID=A0A650EMM9_9FIRM|nr:1,4-alpha-glucan branching enzyme GlgB [uncultured Firmicutes bacterium]